MNDSQRSEHITYKFACSVINQTTKIPNKAVHIHISGYYLNNPHVLNALNMSETLAELLFFDTFAHDSTEEINLDLVQFPKPVYITEVRIIPLGAKVQADFPGGVRLGATNPSQFQIDFLVNDLGKPGASTFETLGSFEYDQNGKINLECAPDETVRKIPTDGLVLKGLYTTITLAVYGKITNNLAEHLIQPIVNPTLPNQLTTIPETQVNTPIVPVEPEWSQDDSSQQQPIPEYPNQVQTNFPAYGHQPEPFPQHQEPYQEYYSDPPKDPRGYHHTPETEWESKSSNRARGESDRGERTRDIYQEREVLDRRERRYSRSESKDRDRKDYHHESGRDRDHERMEYSRSDRDRGDMDWQDNDRERDRDRDRAHDRDRERTRESRRHDDGNYRRYREDREDRKRPKTPPIQSPKRPHSPPRSEQSKDSTSTSLKDDQSVAEETSEKPRRESKDEKAKGVDDTDGIKDSKTPPVEEAPLPDVEEFEPILSDEDILDDNEHYQEEYDYTAYTNNDDIIKQFVPGVTELKKCPKTKYYSINDNAIEVEENLKTSIAIGDDYLKSSITKYELANFRNHNAEIKEEFVHLCEKLMGVIGDATTFTEIMKVHNAIRSLVTSKLSAENKELLDQTVFVIETITDWLKISLNYDLANCQEQPAYKIRHIKCGVRLTEWLCSSEEYIEYIWNQGFNLHQELLNLYQQEFMALSIKLMILKALDSYLLHKFAIEKFLQGNQANVTENGHLIDNIAANNSNGYKTIVEAMQKNPLVREKFALSSIIRKLNVYEIMYKIHSILIKLKNVSHDISAEEINLITKSLNQILSYCNSGPFSLSQPKRFLPVAAQFEIIRTETNNVLVRYFKMFNLLQCFVLLLTSPSTLNLPPIKTPIFDIVSVLLDTVEGLEYLSENCETINVLLKCLLRTDEEMQYSINDSIELHSHNLGLKIAYKIQSLYHVECLLDMGKKCNYDCNSLEIIDHLHNLFCLTFSTVGKFCVGETLAMGGNIISQLQFIEESSLMKLKQSPAAEYILDLIYFPVVVIANVSFLEKYAHRIRDAINMLYDPVLSSKINEIKTYLMPLDNINALSYDNIAPFVDIINRHTETVISHPGSLVTCLRILKHLGISPFNNKSPIISENPLCNYVELKYKHVILQLYSLDGVTILVKLLQKLCNHFEQPGLHSSIFVSNQGIGLVNIIYPTIVLLSKMMAYVIQCRNTEFKDLTAVPVLLQTYNLLSSFPVSEMVRECKIAIVESLLVYTQPISDEVHEKDSISKTLWAQMLGEVIKFITTAPYTFVSGLLVLSELLPLPLPIQTRDDLTKQEISWIINLRKLWSAHLHPHSALLQDTINKICISSQPQLLNLLRRICIQISDLAANSALMIAKGFLDTIYNALLSNEKNVCSSHVARLLNFLACLVTHSPIKCAVLHLVHSDANITGKSEKYSGLIPIFSQIVKTSDLSNNHIQAQECILSVVQSLCDIEISLLQSPEQADMKVSSEVYLANSLPIKEHLQSFIDMILDHLAIENSFVTYLPIVRTLLLLTEHDYGFYHLREKLVKRDKIFLVILNKLRKEFAKNSPECLSTLNTLVEFLRVCLTTEEDDEGNMLYDPRTITLGVGEVKSLIGWSSDSEENSKHPFVLLEEILKKETEDDSSFETILEGLSLFLKQLQSVDHSEIKSENHREVFLPEPEPLLTQHSCRIVFNSSDACDERLTDRYWLVTPAEEGEGELETIQCDLFEICRQLPSDFNLIKEVEKLCRISRTEPTNMNKILKHSDDQRVKTRKPFITPMRPRGFPRTAPQRPDLFRSRPPNTSRPPSLHVDDFVALETCGAQPTGPTGYNKLSREILASTRMARGSRGRAFVTSERSMQYNRQVPWWGAPMGRGPYF
ncbi:protein virilizer isoform X2 [Anthonomus grandis grandis]|uniref:protein virilizer isoform X2 n=1 Tax=Anthonomus grandis grandis TaxID=2921223 RepID=UPI0021664C72|nr:protein virilizer isoform X2 [Anthonomus grandis grandis]